MCGEHVYGKRIVRALEQRAAVAVEQALTNHIMRASGSLVEDVKQTLTES
jgi:DNA-binding GntR family transcriptional regulator